MISKLGILKATILWANDNTNLTSSFFSSCGSKVHPRQRLDMSPPVDTPRWFNVIYRRHVQVNATLVTWNIRQAGTRFLTMEHSDAGTKSSQNIIYFYRVPVFPLFSKLMCMRNRSYISTSSKQCPKGLYSSVHLGIYRQKTEIPMYSQLY